MSELTPERLERRAMRQLLNGAPDRAEVTARKLIAQAPERAFGWAALRGALAAQGRPADAEALRAGLEQISPDAQDLIDRLSGRKLSPRGLIFDPAERFRIRSMAEVLAEAPSAEALRAGDNLVWFQDRGGKLFERSPVLELDGAGGPAYPVRYETPPKFVAVYRNAAVVAEGLVLTEEGDFIDEALQNSPDKYGASRRGDELVFQPPHNSGGLLQVKAYDTPAFLMCGPTDTSFGDWMSNFFPRLNLYDAAGLDCPILVRWKPAPHTLPILEALGFGPDRIIFHTTDQVSLFPKLYVPCWPSRDKAAPMVGLAEIYRRAAVPPGPDRPLIYFDRRRQWTRPLANEDEVCALFASRGFRIVNPGTMSFEETRRLLSAPACVAGAYGSAFHNLVFSSIQPLSLVLMPAHRPHHLGEIARWHTDRDARFAYVLGEMPPEPHDRFTPWTVSLKKLERALDRVMELIRSDEPAPPA